MSGGYFNYDQYKLERIADDIETVLREASENHDEGVSYDFSQETIDKFNETITALTRTGNMVRRIDWLLSGDDNEEAFHKRWKEDVK